MQRYRKQRNYGCRIHDQVTVMGMRTVVIENDKVRISILADKGTEIFEFLYKPLDLDFMWLSENGVQRPGEFLSTSPDPLATFLDHYSGGWQEVFPNGGPTSEYMGATFGQHGEVANMPWDYEIVEDTMACVSVRFTVRTKKVPFLLSKTLTLRQHSPILEIDERLVNLSGVKLHYMWGQHIAFGRPFLAEGCRIRLPEGIRIVDDRQEGSSFARVARTQGMRWPNVPGRDGRMIDLSVLPPRGEPSDVLYLTGFDAIGWYEVENAQLGVGFRTEWDAARMPYLWYWQEFGATVTYPWYGRHYNIGLEPFAGYPTAGLAEAAANGSAAIIDGHGTAAFAMKAGPFELA